MLDGLATQITKTEIVRTLQGGAHVSRLEAADLQSDFQKYRIGHGLLPIGGEVPRIGRHVVLRLDDSACGHLPGLPFDARDAIDERIGRSWQSSNEAILVEDAIRLA